MKWNKRKDTNIQIVCQECGEIMAVGKLERNSGQCVDCGLQILDVDKIADWKKKPLTGEAIIKFDRVSSNEDLFDVAHKTGGHIEMSIHTARSSEFYGEMNHTPHRQLVSVSLSPVQFASAITQMNIGEGHSCTLNYIDGTRIDYQSKKDEVTDTFAELALKGVEKTLNPSIDEDRLISLLDGVRMNKEKRAEIMRIINPFILNRNANRKFALERLDECIHDRVERAKGDIKAYIEMILVQTGLDTLEKNKLEVSNMKHIKHKEAK